MDAMKTLYIDLDEGISDILHRIRNLKTDHLLLIIPKKAQIFKNAVNLKLLKETVSDLKKEIVLFTNDDSGKTLASRAGIRLYQGQITPVGSQTSHLERLPEKPIHRQEGKKKSISEISHESRKKTSKAVLSNPQKREQKKERKLWMKNFFIMTLKKKTIIGFTFLSLMSFFLVLYIAIPSATVTVKSESNVLEATVNMLFADSKTEKNLFTAFGSHVIPSHRLELSYDETVVQKATGKVFTGRSAECTVKIKNLRTTPWALLPKTRLRNNEGVVFRSQTDLLVGASQYVLKRDLSGKLTQEKMPGTLIAHVEADEKDEKGGIIGARGNLPTGAKLHFPGLSVANQLMLTAETEGPCTSGVTDYYSVVTKDDLTAAKKKTEEIMKKSGKDRLLKSVEQENVSQKIHLVVFDSPGAIRFDLLSISIPPDLEGKRFDDFRVLGKMKVMGIAYEKQDYDDTLEEGLLAKVHPSKTLRSLDSDSSTSSIVYSDSDLKNLNRVKVSVTVRGIEEYTLDPYTDRGQELVKRIKETIAGKTISEATDFITNLEEIQKTHISVWPLWRTRLPSRPGSITIRVE